VVTQGIGRRKALRLYNCFPNLTIFLARRLDIPRETIHNANFLTGDVVETTPYRTIGRLTRYWRTMRDLASEGESHIYSHLLAAKAQVTAAQVRRDLMVLGYTGTPARGYEVKKLREHIEAFLFPSTEDQQKAAIAGVGNFGRALLKFFSGRRPTLKIVASFEADPDKFDRVIGGCRCYSIEKATEVIQKQGITVGVIAVPDREAQDVADVFVEAGVRGIMNFARTPLRTPEGIYVEEIDLAMSMDRVAFFARQSRQSPKAEQSEAPTGAKLPEAFES
jgi:redox-sensing transcriptional repressor